MCNQQTTEQINETLRNNTQEWVKEVFERYYKDCKKYMKHNKVGLSCPFYFALSDEYVHSKQSGKKRLMIVGQEARGFGDWERDGQKPGYEAKTSQEWSQKFLKAQINNDKDDEILCSFGEPYICKRKNSPFWDFFRELKDDFAICWDDVDKVYFTSIGHNKKDENAAERGDNPDKKNDKKEIEKRGTLTYQAETHLSRRDYNDENRSLLECEIKIADPDVLVFTIGPNYAVTLDVALGITNKDFTQENECALREHNKSVSKLFEVDSYPTLSKCIVENKLLKEAVKEILGREISVFWTYHPAGLRRIKNKDNDENKWDYVIKTIKNVIRQQ